ncbi:hypothetical protein [Methylococcus capsulatus]|uniref:hypothetical protein n=1 Tax=Methylococcus capsulatus TaxID=414 RepID=UPI001C52C831|nr:hypothetical protein [Methylococcus capsulatus]QXP88677.1 hypothetical protein KW112_06105 [Methylococcus capsulatus]QXP94291.1 hypothetical protein KW113_03530 [Methylococcus capsulatus]UQN10953.1 hypothetical protein M3M30_07835 [Methylococcus capsulatus]
MPTLNWIGKEAVVKHHKEVPFRLLEPVPELSCPPLLLAGDGLSLPPSPASGRGEKAVEGLGGGFQFCRLSAEPLFDADGQIRRDVTFAQLAKFVWFAETGTGFPHPQPSPRGRGGSICVIR